MCGAYKKKNDNNVLGLVSSKVNGKRTTMCVAHTRRRTTTTYDYLISRLSAIDTAGFFKGEWKENYYVCDVYKKKNDNNVQLPHISAVSYRYGWFLVNGKRTTMCVAHTRRRTTTTYNGKRTTMCVAHTRRRTTTTYNYLISRLSAIDTAGFFKGEWKENYYVCGAYKKKNDNNVQLPHISAVSYRYGWFLQRSMERELLCVWRIQEEERQQRTTTSYLGCQL